MTLGRTSAPTPGPSPVSSDGDEPLDADPAAPQEPDWSPQDIVEEWGFQSFPASDAPANW